MKKYSLENYFEYGNRVFHINIKGQSYNSSDEQLQSLLIGYHHFLNQDNLDELYKKIERS